MTLRERLGSIAILLPLVLPSAGGCSRIDAAGSSSSAALVSVKGVITYKSIPLKGGTITFEPLDAGREAHGAIGPDGSFTLTTFHEDDGAIRGVHRISVSGTGKQGKGSVPARYRNAGSSGVEVEVTADRTDYLIELK